MHPAFNRSSQKPPQGVNAPLDDRGRTALHLAVEKNDERAVQRLLRLGAHINQTDKQGQTPLFEAAAHKNAGMIDLLTSRGARIDHRDTQGRSIADWAIEKGADALFVDILAGYGAPFEPARTTRRTPLHRAAAEGRSDLIDTLLLQGISINARDSEGKTPLLLAAENGQLDAMRALVARGASPVMRDNDIVTPLHAAAARGDAAAVDFLLTLPEVRTNINQHAAYSSGFTPVMVAASKNHVAVIERLVAHGADVNQTDNQNRHSLFIAVETGQTDAVRKLIALGADAGKDVLSNSNKSPMMHWIHEKDYKQTLALLVEAGADINATDSNGQTALHRACDYMRKEQIPALLQMGAAVNGLNHYGQRPIDELMDNYGYRNEDMPALVSALLAHGADPGISPSPLVQRAPLHVAVEAGHVESTRLLLQKGAPVDVPERSAQHMTPLLMAAENGNRALAEMLLAHGANPAKADAEGRGPLHLAARSGNGAFCEFLHALDGIDLDARDKAGWTPLHHACAREKTSAVRALIGLGADLHATDNDGLTPLHRAMQERSDDVIDAYVQALGGKADFDAPSQNGDTPLMIAVRTGFTRSVDKLLAAGADVTRAQPDTGRTALHIALAERQSGLALSLAVALQARQINPDTLADKDGDTPLHAAMRGHDVLVCEKLIECGADVSRRNAAGETPLHVALASHAFGMADLLLSAGAKVDIADNNGDTPLHIAVRAHNAEAVKELLERGARALTPNAAGETPVDIALREELPGIFETLLPAALKEEAGGQDRQSPPAQTDAKKPPRPPAP